MDIFDFEELVAEMLEITDVQREDESYLPDEFYKKFNIDLDTAYEFTRHLIIHTPLVEAGISGNKYHAFVSSEKPVMLMKLKVDCAIELLKEGEQKD